MIPTTSYLIDTSAIIALKLIIGAILWSRAVMQLGILISTILNSYNNEWIEVCSIFNQLTNTIWITIAQPLPRNALCSIPLLVLFTCELCFIITFAVIALMTIILI